MAKNNNSGIRIDCDRELIIMNSAFAKKARIFDSAEYKALERAVKTFPSYKVTTKTIKKNPNKERYKGLTYDYMREHIIRFSKDTQNLQILEEMIFESKAHSIKYPTIKKWFLENYPDFANYGTAKTQIAA